MRKASNLLWVLLIMAALVFAGCATGGKSSETGSASPVASSGAGSSTTLKTYYIKAVDTSREAPWNDISGINRIHFHANGENGFKVQKVFVSNTTGDGVPGDAFVWYDFTKGNSPGDYETGNYGGTLVSGNVGGGLWIVDKTGEADSAPYIGNLGIALDGMAYIGFVIANVSNTVKFDNVLLEVHGTENKPSKTLAYYFGL